MLQSNTIFSEITTGKLDSIEYGVYRCTISDDIRTQNVTMCEPRVTLSDWKSSAGTNFNHQFKNYTLKYIIDNERTHNL